MFSQLPKVHKYISSSRCNSLSFVTKKVTLLSASLQQVFSHQLQNPRRSKHSLSALVSQHLQNVERATDQTCFRLHFSTFQIQITETCRIQFCFPIFYIPINFATDHGIFAWASKYFIISIAWLEMGQLRLHCINKSIIKPPHTVVAHDYRVI